MSITTLEQVEEALELERDRAKKVMKDSNNSDSKIGHAYDCGYWEGIAYTLNVITAIIVSNESKK